MTPEVTFAELEQTVSQIRFTGLFASFRLTVERAIVSPVATTFAAAQAAAAERPIVRFYMRGSLPDRDTAEPVSITHMQQIAVEHFDQPGACDLVLDTVRDLARSLAVHEADEAIVYAGIRPFDPHRRPAAP
jgi:hypothetical protein